MVRKDQEGRKPECSFSPQTLSDRELHLKKSTESAVAFVLNTPQQRPLPSISPIFPQTNKLPQYHLMKCLAGLLLIVQRRAPSPLFRTFAVTNLIDCPCFFVLEETMITHSPSSSFKLSGRASPVNNVTNITMCDIHSISGIQITR